MSARVSIIDRDLIVHHSTVASQLIQHGDFASGSEPRVDRKDARPFQRWLEQEVAKVLSEYSYCMLFRFLRRFAAKLAVETWNEQSGQSVLASLFQER